MTIQVTQPQNEALAALNAAMYQAANSGLWETIKEKLSPSLAEEVWKVVGQLCIEAQVAPDSRGVADAGHARDFDVPAGFGPDTYCSISAGIATLPSGESVDLLSAQSALNQAFQETGEPEYFEAADQVGKLTGMWQGPHAAFYPHSVENLEFTR